MSLYNSVRLLRQTLFRQLLSNVNNKEVREIKRWVAPTLHQLMIRRKKVGPEKPEPRSSYLEWNYDAEIYAFGMRLNEEFDENILRKALVHRSYTFDNPGTEDNSQLIEEGENIINNYLKSKFRKYPQEVAEAICNYLTTTPLLAHVATHIGLKDIVLTKEFPVEELTLANTFKSVVTALEKSQNLDKAQIFINDFLVSQLSGKDLFDLWEPKEPYKKLKSELEKSGVSNLEARLCNITGQNTILAAYRVGLYVDKKLLGIGWGESIEIAKNVAACSALQKLYINM